VTRVFDAFGVTVAVRSTDERVFRMLDRLLPPLPRLDPDRTADVVYTVEISPALTATIRRGTGILAINPSPSAACLSLVADLQTVLACNAPGMTFIHAGVVAFGDRAVILPGRPGAGKTTLVAALLAAGARYGSDEFAVVASDGRVHSYARPLSVKRAGDFAQQVPAQSFGAEVIAEPLEASVVAFLEYASTSEFAIRPVSHGAAVLRLLTHCLGARVRPHETLAPLRALTSRAECVAGQRGDSADAAQRLLDVFETRISLARSGRHC
jgi:hypothetical protein